MKLLTQLRAFARGFLRGYRAALRSRAMAKGYPDAYKHPMPHYVLIGGTHDGEPWDGEPAPLLQLPKRIAKQTFAEIKQQIDPAVVTSIKLEQYTRRCIHTPNGDIFCYGLAELRDYDLQLALLKGYHPNRKPGP